METEPTPCGHPAECLNDVFPEDPLCEWCADLATKDREREEAVERARQEEREAIAAIALQLDDEVSCLPRCDSYGHEELCPVAAPLRALADRIGSRGSPRKPEDR